MGLLAGKGWVLTVPSFIVLMILLVFLKRVYDEGGASSGRGNAGQLLGRFRVMTIGKLTSQPIAAFKLSEDD